MGLISGGVSASDLILDGQSVSLYVGGNPPTKVWPTRETVQITLGTGTQAQTQLRAALTTRGMNYQTVVELPFDLDTSQVTGMTGMFAGCSSLTSAPNMDTSKVTNMEGMFAGCSSLTSAPNMDTSKVTSMRSMFEGCSSLTTVPDMNAGSVTNTVWMFNGCAALTDGQVRLIRSSGTKPANRSGMITGSGLTREPFFLPDGTQI